MSGVGKPLLMSLHKEDDFVLKYGRDITSLQGNEVVFGENILRALENSDVYESLDRAGPFGKFIKKGGTFMFDLVKPDRDAIHDVSAPLPILTLNTSLF